MTAKQNEDTKSLKSTLELLAMSATGTAEELKRLRELRHQDGNSLQSYALTQQAIRDHLDNQDRGIEAFRKEVHEMKTELQGDMKSLREIVAGPPGKPEEGIVFQMRLVENFAKSIRQLTFVAISAVIVALATVVINYLHFAKP